MRTTLTLDPEVKKLAKRMAFREGKTLSEFVNLMLKDYVQEEARVVEPVKTGKLSDLLLKGEYGFGNQILDREFIYEKLQ